LIKDNDYTKNNDSSNDNSGNGKSNGFAVRMGLLSHVLPALHTSIHWDRLWNDQ
jgi:hypothetical protein